MHHQLIDLQRFQTPAVSMEDSAKPIGDGPLLRSLLEQVAATRVGHDQLANVLDAVKHSMLKTALWRTGGNYTRTACMLGVTRQAVQQMVARYELCSWVESVRQGDDTEPEPSVTRTRASIAVST